MHGTVSFAFVEVVVDFTDLAFLCYLLITLKEKKTLGFFIRNNNNKFNNKFYTQYDLYFVNLHACNYTHFGVLAWTLRGHCVATAWTLRGYCVDTACDVRVVHALYARVMLQSL